MSIQKPFRTHAGVQGNPSRMHAGVQRNPSRMHAAALVERRMPGYCVRSLRLSKLTWQ